MKTDESYAAEIKAALQHVNELMRQAVNNNGLDFHLDIRSSPGQLIGGTSIPEVRVRIHKQL